MSEKKAGSANLKKISNLFDRNKFKTLHEEMSFSDYIDRCHKNPRLIRTAYQRIYDMIMERGTSSFKKHRKTYTHYNFFDQTDIPIFGLEDTLDQLVTFIKGAAGGYGTEKRVLLLHGPVGSSKSTICRVIKRGMEKYSMTDGGVWYTYKWVNLPTDDETGIYTHKEDLCPMHDDPIKLIPAEYREKLLEELNAVLKEETPEAEQDNLYRLRSKGELNPRCKKFMDELMDRYDGDWEKVVSEHIVVVRKIYSEVNRMGIGTFQPKDEKNQDATELTGDIDYSKLPHFGSDSDPRAFNFDGEFCVGNRGVVEFIEMLKLAQEFLYDLLGASQEQQIKPKKFSQIDVDIALLGHTNNPEYEKLKNNQSMEALRDRTVKIDVPYLLNYLEELEILKHYYGPKSVKQHIAPHTLEIAALWAVLTRLQDDKDHKITSVEKAKLYAGKAMQGWTDDSVKELRDKYPTEGMYAGISCRYIQDKISNCLSSHYDYINPFMVLNELKKGLDTSALISDQESIGRYNVCIDSAMKELDEVLKSEVQKALVGDEEAIIRLCANYIDNVRAYIDKVKVLNPYTGKEQAPDERLMRSIEEKIEIPEVGADDFRRGIATFIGNLSIQNKKFSWDSNQQLKTALEAKLFEDVRDTIKLSALNQSGASVVDPDIQEKIDAIKQRMVKQYGYNEKSATDVLELVGSIFARGDVADNN